MPQNPIHIQDEGRQALIIKNLDRFWTHVRLIWGPPLWNTSKGRLGSFHKYAEWPLAPGGSMSRHKAVTSHASEACSGGPPRQGTAVSWNNWSVSTHRTAALRSHGIFHFFARFTRNSQEILSSLLTPRPQDVSKYHGLSSRVPLLSESCCMFSSNSFRNHSPILSTIKLTYHFLQIWHLTIVRVSWWLDLAWNVYSVLVLWWVRCLLISSCLCTKLTCVSPPDWWSWLGPEPGLAASPLARWLACWGTVTYLWWSFFCLAVPSCSFRCSRLLPTVHFYSI